MKSRTRLDRLLVDRALAPTRAKAQGLILAGQVLVDEQKVEKCGALVAEGAALRLTGAHLKYASKYASRAGLKLEGALDYFSSVDVRGRVCLDIGASTGGFTDCLLQRGASRVFAVDVGTHQLDWRLRSDPRVVSLEKVNARYLTLPQIGARVSLAVMDVSFISATLILPVLPPLLEPGAGALVLVKPQFEAGKGQVGKGGIVRDERLHREAVEKVSKKLADLGFGGIASTESVLPGAGGNREYFVYAMWGAVDSPLSAVDSGLPGR
ncbi:MAG TPA: TlyA family RNA methyltransferase [Candidatus Sulfopaludibacter sp.]|nr:TlyA family RNA methyltransferase [Terriglobia bacterium]HEV2444714.1 TlyA family RNA methyltransferase [Candidatus Sulfopaludibacter sp.]